MSDIISLKSKVSNYCKANKDLAQISETPLWFSYEKPNPIAENYARKIATAEGNPVGQLAVVAYGDLYKEDREIRLPNSHTGKEDIINLVGDSYEYYFTDMVFIQRKYEEALIDLYLLKAEDLSNLAAINEAIENTFWVAKKNGVKLTPDIIQEKYLEQLNIRLDYLNSYLYYIMGEYFPKLKKYIKEIIDFTRSYYANPSADSFENLANCISNLEGTVFNKNGLGVFMLTMRGNSGLRFPDIPSNSQENK